MFTFKALRLLLALPLLSLAQSNPWSLGMKQVGAGKAFTLQLLNANYGKCSSSFSNLHEERSGRNLQFIFQSRIDSAKPCSPDTKPWGPVFEMEALAAGKYPVAFWQAPACYPDCHVIPDFRPLDTLSVETATMVSAPGAGRAALRFQGNPLRLLLPEGSGLRSVELRSPAGDLLVTYRVTGADEAILPVASRLGRGVFLVRLVSGEGEIRGLRLFNP